MPKVPSRSCEATPQTSRSNGKVYIGIDPGMNGGLVAITPKTVVVTPMPSTERDVYSWFYALPDIGYQNGAMAWNMMATIEKVSSMPRNGVASMFKFGWGYGGLRMSLIAVNIPFEETTPQTWMKAFGIAPRVKPKKKRGSTKKVGGESDTQWKDRLRAKAQQLFPDLECWGWNVTEQRKVSDALLIAEYCRRKAEGRL